MTICLLFSVCLLDRISGALDRELFLIQWSLRWKVGFKLAEGIIPEVCCELIWEGAGVCCVRGRQALPRSFRGLLQVTDMCKLGLK